MSNFRIPANSNKDFCYKWLSVLSGMIPLTKKELIILSSFLQIYLEKPEQDLFSMSNRKKVRESLEVSTYYLNNYINSLKNKNAIFIEEGRSGIKSILIPKLEKEGNNIFVNININIILSKMEK